MKQNYTTMNLSSIYIICFFSIILCSCSDQECTDNDISVPCNVDAFIGEWEFIAQDSEISQNECLSNLQLSNDSRPNVIINETDLYLPDSSAVCMVVRKTGQFTEPYTEYTILDSDHIKEYLVFLFASGERVYRRKN